MHTDQNNLIQRATISRMRKYSQMDDEIGKKILSNKLQSFIQFAHFIMYLNSKTTEYEANFDILECFPILLCQYVFQHFSGKELLEISEVNQEWNKLVGEASQMTKLNLVIDTSKRKLTPEVENLLKNSKRKYQNIRAKVSSNNSDFLLDFLTERAGSWKVVNIKVSQDLLPEVLLIIEPSVIWLYKCLLLSSRTYEHWHQLDFSTTQTPDLCWKHAKSLQIFRKRHDSRPVQLRSSIPIVSHQLPGQITEATSDVQTILRHNSNLKELNATNHIELFENLSEIKFKLQKLRIAALDTPDFISFLVTQSPSLKKLEIQKELSRELLELILRMPRLTSLAIDSISTDDDFQEILANPSITSFEVKAEITAGAKVKSRKRVAYHKLIRDMPSLKHFKCNEIDDELLLLLVVDVPDLESIEVHFFNVIRIPERSVFPNIKKFKAYKFRSYLQEPSGNDNFAELVKSEKQLSIDFVDSDTSDEEEDYYQVYDPYD